MNRKIINGTLAGMALAGLLLATVVAAFHYHDNGTVDNNCPLCRFQVYNNDSTITAVEYHFSMPETVRTHIEINRPLFQLQYHCVSLHNHAPPVT